MKAKNEHSSALELAMLNIEQLLRFYHKENEFIVKFDEENLRIEISPMIIGGQFNSVSEFSSIVDAIPGLSAYITIGQLPIVADEPYGESLSHIYFNII